MNYNYHPHLLPISKSAADVGIDDTYREQTPDDSALKNLDNCDVLDLVLLDRDETGNAETAFRRAVKINPEYAEAHRNLSHVLLLARHLDEGWKEFRWRWRCRDFPAENRPFPRTPWSGEPVDGRTVWYGVNRGSPPGGHS